MTTREKLIGLIVFVGLVILVGTLVSVREVGERQGEYTTNTGELLQGSLVGQTFVAGKDDLSGVAVMLATYSGRVKTGTVELHVQDLPAGQAGSIGYGRDLRTDMVDVSQLGDNQWHRFKFEPIADSAGQSLFFYVTSLEGVAGNAVAVDINGKDPYPLGSAYLVRGHNDEEVSGDVLVRSGKQSLDMAFEIYYTVPLRVAVMNKTVATGKQFVQTWDEMHGKYIIWAKVGVPALLFITLMVWLRRLSLRPRQTLLVLFVLAIVVRLIYAVELPLTNDEGNYLYDARTLLEGGLAGGDGYVKAPLVVIWLAIWQFILGQTILAGRLSSVVIGAATLWPMYLLGRGLGSIKTGLVAAGAWALMGVTTVFNIYVHTQPLALFFGIFGLAVLSAALRGKLGPPSRRARFIWLFVAGVLLGLGVVSRKSILALGLVPLALVVREGQSWRGRLKDLIIIGLGFLLVVSLFLGGAAAVYGKEGFWEALGANSAEDGISAVDPAEVEQVRAYSLRGMTPFFRESLPLILLAMIGLGVALEKLFTRRFVKLIAWAVPIAIFWWAWGFFLEYEGSSVMVFGMKDLWYAMAAGLILVAILYRGKASDKPGQWAPVLVPVLWMAGLIFFYTNWIKFHANYIGEFLPPLVLLGALGAPVLMRKSAGRWLVLAVMLWALFVSGYVTLVYEHTGTFQLQALREAAEWTKNNIPKQEEIFTGAAAVPYLSGHHTALNIAHPRWYAYEFTRKDPERLNTFLPPAEEMVQAFKEAEWFLMDKQTGFSFLMEYSEIEGGLEQEFEAVKGISNGSNTLTFYRRIK
ncbi:MAG: glycosyltransferase family 39 protein [bacterium]